MGLAGPGLTSRAVAQEPVTVILKGDETPEAIKRTIEALSQDGKAVTIRIVPAKAAGPSASNQVDDPANRIEAFWDHFVDGFMQGNAAVPAVARLPADWVTTWAANTNGRTGLSAGAALVLCLLLAAFGAIAVRAASRTWFAARATPASAMLIERFRAAGVAAGHDLLTLAAFWLIARLATRLLLPEPDLAAKAAGILILATSYGSLYAIVGRFVLGPDAPARRLLPLPRAERHFRMLIVYAVLGQITLVVAALGNIVATDRLSTTGLFAIVTLPVAVFKLYWFWDMRHDLTALILGGATDPDRRGPRWLVAHATPWFYIASSVVIWMTGRAATMMPDGFRWGVAAGQTQVLLALIPLCAAGLAALIRSVRMRRRLAFQPGPVANAMGATLESGVGALAWAGGLYLMVRIWSGLVVDVSSPEYTAILRQALVVASVTFIGWVLLTFLRAFFDAYAPARPASGPADEDAVVEDSIPSRLATVIPVMRGLVLGAVVALTALIVISRLGIDIGPLLAGFGILGLAISFGSQALVRDIVSGFFFMVEDAFRVGEYVDTGRLKGTVEKISLRSVQLRHQSGVVHTVPFGQIPSLTNASRDWATVKFNLRLDRSIDIEKARKVIKKIGIAMQEDPELAPHLIAPLKMQGVADIAENAIVVRLKFTAKPAHASVVQREAMKRVYRGLNEAGIPFASNAVTINNSAIDDDRRAAAAIASLPVSRPATETAA
jgi:small-conductance mechanosensitive channel